MQTVRYQALKPLFFLKIATVPLFETFAELPKPLQEAWTKKMNFLAENETPAQLFEQKGGMYAEFGKIVALGMGFFNQNTENVWELRLRSWTAQNETELLEKIVDILEKLGKQRILVGHNAKEFDFPYLCRRLLINSLPIPPLLDHAGKKPWQVPYEDTMELWRFGEHKHYVSLQTLSAVFGIDFPLLQFDGSQISDCFYQKKDTEAIAEYCRNFVARTAQIYIAIKQNSRISAEQMLGL